MTIMTIAAQNSSHLIFQQSASLEMDRASRTGQKLLNDARTSIHAEN